MRGVLTIDFGCPRRRKGHGGFCSLITRILQMEVALVLNLVAHGDAKGTESYAHRLHGFSQMEVALVLNLVTHGDAKGTESYAH